MMLSMMCFHLGQSVNLFAMDDSDLTGLSNQRRIMDVSLEIQPDKIRTETSNKDVFAVEVLREDHGKLISVPAVPFKWKASELAAGRDTIHVEAILKNEFFEVSDGNQPYRIVADIPAQGKNQLIFLPDSSGGQVLGIWQVAQRAKTKLESEVGLSFWKTPLSFSWPAEGDYYAFGEVHLTRGDHWDVVGHEMGHGIYDLANLGVFGGGAHKIDECYSEALAISEGWASFFSAWLNVDLQDPDAKFEYMVPRRAPIRFESIPSDVCPGQTNEWRVTGFFWDLVDLHDDSEKATELFARMWNAMKGTRVGSALAAKNKLKNAGFDPELLQIVWDLNFGK